MAKKKPAPKRGASRYQAPAKKSSVPGWVWLVAGLAIGGFIMFLMKLEPGRNDVKREKAEAPKAVVGSNKPSGTVQPQQPAAPTGVKPKYDFYTLLPGSEVAVPPEAVPPPTQPAKPQTPPTVVATKEEAEKIDTQRALTALSGQTPPPPAVVKPATPATPPATQVATAQKQALPQAPASDTTPAKPTPPPAVAATQYYLQAGSFRKQTDADHLRAQIIMMGQNARVESGTVRDETWYRVMVGPYGDRAKASAAQKQLAGNGFSNLLLQQRQTR
ncbi:SPOR domain-containing protein [Pseudomonas nitroreducens]|uniref:SPOR domain-containing protein n=1 Tax=Pseudomonas nitroreducens TaxID=46680 RepID=A0ABS0KJF8_PSENT|nr:SPOR domain-containing protein [Pseudomonas nitroreducens]MBG6288108.1 SPOR domain-containing protein [Pseudomonas nitroreducens]MDH1071883.1 SPOR domain-containing protein [Pseudomonas nitroreducens]WEW99687.1 SPOR domain-containing protein [Pseudomonas nitroreducens]